MRIEHISRSTLKIILNSAELSSMGLRREEIDGKNPVSRLLVLKFLEKLRPQLDSSPAANVSQSIEMFPLGDWGCVIYVYPVFRKQASLLRSVITVYSVNSLIRLCRILYRMSVPSAKTLVTGEKSCLRLVAPLPCGIEGYYAVPADENALACIKEHGRIIIPDNAVETVLKISGAEKRP